MPVDTAELRVIQYPAPILRAKSRTIPAVSDEVRSVARRMIELMHEAEGIGLAANQVGLPWRLFVANVPPADPPEEFRSLAADPPSATRGPVVYVNPVFSDPQRDLVPYDEGCLSLPDITGEVRRPSEITIAALDLEGRPFTSRAGGLLARCWQHEVDHLDGVLIIDRMTPIARMKNRMAIRDMEAAAEER